MCVADDAPTYSYLRQLSIIERQEERSHTVLSRMVEEQIVRTLVPPVIPLRWDFRIRET